MKPEKINIKEKNIIGISARTNNKDEQSPVNGKLMKLWGSFFENGLMSKIPNQKENSPKFGVYSSYESDFNGDYTVTVGMEVSSNDSASEYKEIKIEGGEYLLFKAKGKMPNIVMDTWKEIWEYFSTSNIERKYSTDFELYKSEDEVEIYIAVK